MRMPSSMPAGTSTVMLRRARTRPSVPQVGHGDGICCPVPPQTVHGRLVMTWPRNERWMLWISPAPPQVWQVIGDVPGAQPSPWHVSQTIAVSTAISRRTPKAVSFRVSSMRSSASPPCRTRLRGPRVVPPEPPKKASKTSPNEPKPPNGLPAPPPPPDCSGSPPRSTTRRFSGSDSTS